MKTVEDEKTASPFLEINPQQTSFVFGSLKFDSKFDSGNLGKVTNVEPNTVQRIK